MLQPHWPPVVAPWQGLVPAVPRVPIMVFARGYDALANSFPGEVPLPNCVTGGGKRNQEKSRAECMEATGAILWHHRHVGKGGLEREALAEARAEERHSLK